MKAIELYKKLDTDFELDDCKDDWSHMDFNEYISDNFKKCYMGLLLDNTEEINSVYTAVFPSDLVLNKIIEFCESSKTEIFGYLIGNILKWNEKLYIEIEEPLFILGAIHSDAYSTAQIEGAAGHYQNKFQRLKKKRHDDDLRVLGWFHSHPGFGCFLSTTDLHTQEYFFPESYQTALVVDPINDDLQFFTMDESTEKKYKSISYAILTQNSDQS